MGPSLWGPRSILRRDFGRRPIGCSRVEWREGIRAERRIGERRHLRKQRLVLRSLRIALVAPSIQVELKVEATGRLPVEQEAGRVVVDLTKGIVARIAVLPIIGLGGRNRQTRPERIAERTTDMRVDVEPVESPVGEISTC